jgi:hypothetical protein
MEKSGYCYDDFELAKEIEKKFDISIDMNKKNFIKLQKMALDMQLDIKITNDAKFIEQLLILTSTCTSEYDESHDINHHFDTLQNTINIVNKEFEKLTPTDDSQLLRFLTFISAFIHDTIDPKYPDKLHSKKILVEQFLKNYCEKYYKHSAQYIDWIINNMSYSKEKKLRDKGLTKEFHKYYIVNYSRNIVSDADKLEAIGEIGIRRCREFTKTHNNIKSVDEIDKLVVEHCHDKLKHLLPSYIVTKAGKEIGKSRHQIILNFIEQYEKNYGY